MSDLDEIQRITGSILAFAPSGVEWLCRTTVNDRSVLDAAREGNRDIRNALLRKQLSFNSSLAKATPWLPEPLRGAWTTLETTSTAALREAITNPRHTGANDLLSDGLFDYLTGRYSVAEVYQHALDTEEGRQLALGQQERDVRIPLCLLVQALEDVQNCLQMEGGFDAERIPSSRSSTSVLWEVDGLTAVRHCQELAHRRATNGANLSSPGHYDLLCAIMAIALAYYADPSHGGLDITGETNIFSSHRDGLPQYWKDFVRLTGRGWEMTLRGEEENGRRARRVVAYVERSGRHGWQ